MKAVRIYRFGGPDVLTLEEVPVPSPGEEELLLRVHAASVNPVDYKIRQGKYPPVSVAQLPLTLGRDASGQIESCGSAVRGLREGDAIYVMLGSLDRGTYAEHVVVRPGEAAAKPSRLSHLDAAAVPLAGLTAWQGLFDHGHLQGGQRVLIHGGSGGVGHFAIQFAKARGATVVTTVAEENIDFVRELGADEAIDYRAQPFETVVRDVDMVFDLVGGETQERSWQVLKPGGVLVSTLGEPPREKATQHNVHGVGYVARPDAGELAEIGRLIDGGKVRPVIAATYPLAEARQAHERLERGHVRGKIALTIAD